MNRLALPLLIAVWAMPAAACAQQVSSSPVVAPGDSVLTVSAEGKSLRTPDLAVFNAGVTTQGKTAGEALAENSTAMARVIAQLKHAGIAERDIQTSNLTVEPVYSDPNRVPRQDDGSAAPTIVGYRASNSVSVRQRDLKNFGRVIDTLVAAGANQVNGPSFTMGDPDPALDEARLDAMRKARARAELYARAAGLRVLRILTISESGGYYGAPQVMFSRVAGGIVPPPPPPAPMQPGELQLTANVTVTYELAP